VLVSKPTENIGKGEKKATTREPRRPHSPPRTVTMQLRNDIQTLDAYRPTFDPHLDIATVVFSHVQCVKTRHSLALVSKLWRDASNTAAAYPLEFEFDAFPDMASWKQSTHVTGLLDNDEALSLPYERVVGLLGAAAKNVCEYAAMRGSVRLLKWTRENNRDWSAVMCHHAAAYGHLPALQYLHENGCPLDEYTSRHAAANGQLPALKYLHENGCPWNANTCSSAALNGHLPALKYLHETGCPWDSHTCSNAALNGHLPALKYLHENGCPWDSNTCSSAAHNGQLPALKYLHETGCPWNSHTCYCAAFSKQWDCLQYAVDNKCPGWEKYAKEYAEHLR
jgi:hypothetical protein